MLGPGTQLGRYIVLSKLGAGSMGEVFLARDLRLDRKVALKVLPSDLAVDGDRLARFVREARATSALNHPNILTVYEIGEEAGTHFIATELVDGLTLREWARSSMPELVDLLDAIRQAAAALSVAHHAGIVHRDVKPENLMRRDDGLVKMLDFGIAKVVSSADPGCPQSDTESLAATTPGMMMGTIRYMSPEQVQALDLDARTDVWSLGVVLYELVSGRPPFGGASIVETAAAILCDEPVPLERLVPDAPAALCRTVARALRKPAAERVQTAAELAEALEEVVRELEQSAHSSRRDGPHPSVETRGFDAPVTVPQDEESRDAAAPMPPTNLSLLESPLVGRERELAEVVELLRQSKVRMLTITGPGGTGKTRLALAAARALLPEFDGGAFFVNLSAIRDPALVLPTAARELGVVESGGVSPEEAIVAHVGGRATLVVLDNFEQVVEAAPAVARLLKAAPSLKLLVTSRVLLHVSREREVALPPLALPPADRRLSVEELGRWGSVALFVERARAARKSFELTERNAGAVCEICRRLDGLPLAIELAAARLKLLVPEALLARLDERLRLLTGGARDLPERQQTMRAAIAWSDGLLKDGERRVFYRLSVFAGGCTYEAAEAVCGGDGAAEILDALGSLVESSLLEQRATKDGGVRFRMLEVVREYAHERLAASGEVEAFERRHAETFAALAEAAKLELRGRDSVAWLERLDLEHDNLRLMLTTWLREDPERGLFVAASLSYFWSARGHHAEGRRWLGTALERGADAPPEARIWPMYEYASTAIPVGDTEAVRVEAGAVIELAETLGDTHRLAAATYLLGVAESFLGNAEAARGHLERSLVHAREIRHERLIEHCLNSLGEVARLTGDFATARDYYEQALATMREGGAQDLMVLALTNLGAVACEEGDFAAGRAHYAEALEVAYELQSPVPMSLSIEGLAMVAVGRGAWRRAGRLYGMAEALRAGVEFKAEPMEKVLRDRALEAVRAHLGDAGLAAALDEGRALSVDEAVREALEADEE